MIPSLAPPQARVKPHLGGNLFLCCQSYAVLGQYADHSACLGDGLHCVLHLVQAPFWAERSRSGIISSRHSGLPPVLSNWRKPRCDGQATGEQAGPFQKRSPAVNNPTLQRRLIRICLLLCLFAGLPVTPQSGRFRHLSDMHHC